LCAKCSSRLVSHMWKEKYLVFNLFVMKLAWSGNKG
jgi:hypothetical protein